MGSGDGVEAKRGTVKMAPQTKKEEEDEEEEGKEGEWVSM